MCRTVNALLASLLTLTACTSGSPSTTPATPMSPTSAAPVANDAAVVTWIDNVCGAINSAVKALSEEPAIDMNNPLRIKTGLSDWLGTKVAVIDKSTADLKVLEDGPHPKSRELVTNAEEGMDRIKTVLTDTKSKLDTSTDATQIIAVFTELISKGAALEKTGAGVRNKFDAAGLAAPAQKAPNCKDMELSPHAPPTS